MLALAVTTCWSVSNKQECLGFACDSTFLSHPPAQFYIMLKLTVVLIHYTRARQAGETLPGAYAYDGEND